MVCAPLAAQIDMPDPSQIAGVPLPAPELPSGTVSVRVVRERMGNNLSGQTVTLSVGGARRTAVTDAQGRAEFASLPVAAAVVAETTVDGEALRSREFTVPERGGVRVALIAGIAAANAREAASAAEAAKMPARPGVVAFGGESRIIMEFQDDTLQVFYILEIVNNARTPIDTGGPLIFSLPSGTGRGNLLDGSSRQAAIIGSTVTINGPFAPGITPVQLGFSVPDSGAVWTWRQQWPAAFEQPVVAVQKIGNLTLSSPHLPRLETLNAAGGRVFMLANGPRVNAGGELAVTVSGIPAHSMTSAYVALAMAGAIVAAGLWFGIGRPPAAVRPAPAALAGERTKLMNELVAIETRQRKGAARPQDDARRQAVVLELERVLAALDRAPDGGEGASA
jgi:hypothetical protein